MRTFYRLMLTAIVMAVLSLGNMHAQTKWTELNSWDFRKANETEWRKVTLPHSCNAIDGQSARYYRGSAYYRTSIERSGQEQFLYLMGAAQRSVVSVNGQAICEHGGGYTPYCVRLTPHLKAGTNEIMVECDNTLNRSLAPVSSDFNKNNGLHNEAWLVETGHVYCDFQTMGYDALHVTPLNVSAQSADVKLNTLVQNTASEGQDIRVVFKIKNHEGKTVSSSKQKIHVAAQGQTEVVWNKTMKRPHLWNGLQDPYLYTAEVQLWDGKKMLESNEAKFGVRSFALDSIRGFILNGKPYTLRGFSMHQDWQGSASAVTKEQTDKDFEIVKELGCNVVRLAHYPHNRYILDQCDRLGLVVETEIPWVNECGNDLTLYDQKAYTENLHSQLKEMITNHYNHPSVVFWGLWNELGNIDGSRPQGPKLDVEATVNTTESLYRLAHQLDSTRKVGFADASFALRTPQLQLGKHFDYFAFNTYNGWYSNCKTPEGAVHFDDMLKRLLARTPYIAISEYGSGANPFCHSDNPAKTTRPSVGGARHDEEWGNIVHEIHLKSLCTNSRVQFSTGWILFDFAVGARREGYMLCNDGVNAKVDSSYMFLNDKGIVSRDRKVKKDAFYLYKACWNKQEPTVYITSRRFTERTSDTINVKVYSNLHDLTLYHNGRQVETLHATDEPTGVIWNFSPIAFEKEYDEIMVEGTDAQGQKVQDKIKLRHISKNK